MKTRRAELALVAMTFIWGATFVVIKDALADVSTLLFLALRFGVASLALGFIYRKKLHRRAVLPGVFTGCLLFLAFAFQTKGLELTTPTKSAFLTGLSIPMVPFVSSLVYQNRPRLFEIAGVLIASFGMALMTLPSGRFEMNRGDVFSFLCAVTFAMHIVAVNHFSRTMGFETIACLQVFTAAVLGFSVYWFLEPVRFHVTPGLAAAVLVTGLLGTALAFTVMAWAQQYTSATRSALIFSLEPVVAWITSYIVTGETMNFRGKVGAAAILLGVLIVELRRGAETYTLRETS